MSIVTTVHSTTLSSHCIPAYPEYYSSTTFNAAFYTARQDSNEKLSAETITLVEES